MNDEVNPDEVEVIEGEKLKFGRGREETLSVKNKKKPTAMVALVMKISRGHIKTESQANIVLVLIAVVFIVISFFFYF